MNYFQLKQINNRSFNEYVERFAKKRERFSIASCCRRVYNGGEFAVFYSIAVTGIVSGLSKGAKQTALAHCFYEQARTCFYAECKEALHGELVGVGLILQLKYNGLDNESMLKRLRALGMPTAFSDIHIPPTAQNAVLFAEKLCIPKITSDPMKTKEEVLNAMTAICK